MPPGVVVRTFVVLPEGIHVTVANDLVDPIAFHGEEPGDLLVVLGTGQVDGLVGRIHVAADDQLLAVRAERFPVGQDGLVEIHLVLQPLGVLLSIWEVHVEEGEVGIFQHQRSAFRIEPVLAESLLDAEGFVARVDAHTAVPFFSASDQ